MDEVKGIIEEEGSGTLPRIALVHDFLVSYGGAERVFEVLARMFPSAPLYTLLIDEKALGGHFYGRDIHTSWLGKLPNFLKKRYRFFLLFFPSAVESFDLRDFDVVISSSGAWSKGIVTRLHTKHIAYIHSPMRYAWDYHEQYLEELGIRGKRNIFLRMVLSYLRIWDKQSAERPDILLVNSKFTQERVKKYYRRESVLVYPPALGLSERAKKSIQPKKKGYFLVVSRLTQSKKISLVIEAFNKLGLKLVVVGTGSEKAKLKNMSGENISFEGFVSDDALIDLYLGARAVIFPSEEDFGMVAVEALSLGVPVIAYEYGGIKEIIISGKTGELFHSQTPEVLAEGVRRFLEKEDTYDVNLMKESVASFTEEHFRKEILASLKSVYNV